MPTLERAIRVQKGMGCAYRIYWDKQYSCFRVMTCNSFSHYKFRDNYILLNQL